jgi:hypothetical protein
MGIFHQFWVSGGGKNFRNKSISGLITSHFDMTELVRLLLGSLLKQSVQKTNSAVKHQIIFTTGAFARRD